MEKIIKETGINFRMDPSQTFTDQVVDLSERMINQIVSGDPIEDDCIYVIHTISLRVDEKLSNKEITYDEAEISLNALTKVREAYEIRVVKEDEDFKTQRS